MSCEEGGRHLTGYLDGTLSGESREGFERHLGGCAVCREELDLWIRLEGLPEELPDSLGMQRRFRRALAEELRPRPWFAWPVWAAAAAAALVLVACGWSLGRYAARPSDELSSLRLEVGGLRSMFALSLLAQESASARLQGISYADRLRPESPDVLAALVSALRYDSNVNVRLAACDALRRHRTEPSVRRAFVTALGAEASPMVKVTLIDALADFGERDSIRPLLRLRSEGAEDSAVRERAARALDEMKLKGISWE